MLMFFAVLMFLMTSVVEIMFCKFISDGVNYYQFRFK